MSDSIENILINLVKDSNNIIASNTKTIANNNEEIKILRGENERLREELSYFRDKLNVFMNSTIESNSRLHERMDVLTNSVSSKTVKKPTKLVNTEPRVQCKCMTKKGEQCRKYCIPGHDTCKQHANIANVSKQSSDKPPNESEPAPTPTSTSDSEPVTKNVKNKPGKKRKPVVKKVNPPMHNHDPGEIPSEPCSLCESHGDILDPSMPDEEYTGLEVNGLSLEERLRLAVEKEESGSVNVEKEESENVDVGNNNGNWADMVEDETEKT